jgi:hypothetical protein
MKILKTGLLVVLICLAFSQVAKAISCPVGTSTCSGGVTYTFTNIEQDATNLFDVQMVVDTSGATNTKPVTFSSFAVQFFDSNGTQATGPIGLESSPAGQGWAFTSIGPNNKNGCQMVMKNPASCFTATTAPTIPVGGNGTFTFLFDVTLSSNMAPIGGHIQTMQGTELAISNVGGVGTGGSPPPTVPEPTSLLLFGTVLSTAGFVGKRLLNA